MYDVLIGMIFDQRWTHAWTTTILYVLISSIVRRILSSIPLLWYAYAFCQLLKIDESNIVYDMIHFWYKFEPKEIHSINYARLTCRWRTLVDSCIIPMKMLHEIWSSFVDGIICRDVNELSKLSVQSNIRLVEIILDQNAYAGLRF